MYTPRSELPLGALQMLSIEQDTQLSTSDKPVLSDLLRPLIVILLMTMGSFTFANSKAPLHHALKYPSGSGPFPTIILLHHAGGYLNTLDQIEHYLGLGYAVAMPDYFSPFRLTSQNRFEAFKGKRVDIEKKLTEYVTYLKTQEKIDAENLFAVGLSAGGFFTAFLACDPHRKVSQDFAASNRKHVLILVRRYWLDWLFITQWAQNFHHQCGKEDKFCRWIST